MKGKSTVEVIIFLLVALASCLTLRADAASLMYANATNIYLSSPEITLTIQAGSAADAIVVNATSVAVTLSGSTGATFTLISPQALTSSTVGGGGSLSQTCSSGIETDAITQTSNSETYTLTPTGSACAQPTSSTSPTPAASGGVGVSTGGGGSAYDLSIDNGAATTATTSVTLSLYGTEAYMMELSNNSAFAGATWIPYATALPWTVASTPGLQITFAKFRAVGGTIVGNAQASIAYTPASTISQAIVSSAVSSSKASLEAEIAALQTELAALENQSSAQTASGHFIFIRNLQFGSTGHDVMELQLFLIRENPGPAARALAKHGTTENFASLTKAAVIEFQKSVGIKPAIGFFGPVTRAYVNGRA